ncbi:glutathione S-transferase [Rhodoferax saidenbachensis]|uniref:Glutathione S-transferase n=1 Tax=Rhodoferax saidenbachensis TaxID=1484693 RepID=A0ABU1ZGY6_9BURK|nr:glutathione S-transferase [Rhodoferax saidenbachensis]MDR7304804.1 glutathione S-transferase [Rhodoferax saidenbachensis]
MSLPVLYSFRRCPYAMRARMAMAVSQQVCALREVVLAHKPEALLQASPKGTVPVLVLVDGTVIDQSLDIMLWALQRHDPEHWLPTTEAAWERTRSWIAENDGPFKQALDRYKYPHRYALPDGMAHRAAGVVFLQALDAVLRAQACLAGPQFGLADAALAPFVRQFAHTDVVWFSQQDWPALQAWLTQFEQSTRYLHVMNKIPAWESGQAAVTFPSI